MTELLNPFRAPEPLSILNPSNFVPKKGFPVVKGLNPKSLGEKKIIGHSCFVFTAKEMCIEETHQLRHLLR